MINKKQVDPNDKINIKDNDEYELGSGDDVNDVIPDGKVKMYVSKHNNSNNQVNQSVVNIPQVLQANNLNVAQNQVTSNNIPQQNPQNSIPQSNNEISTNTTVLDMSGFKLPVLGQNDKFVLKTICPQIRKSVI